MAIMQIFFLNKRSRGPKNSLVKTKQNSSGRQKRRNFDAHMSDLNLVNH